MKSPSKRPLTPAYIIFYVLFWPDTWRILIGLLLALVFTPQILPADMAAAGRAMLYVMVAAIGWSLSRKPAVWMTMQLKKMILK